MKLCLKVSCAEVVPIKKLGLSRVLSVTQEGSVWKAELGAVSLEVLTVIQFVPSAHDAPPTVQSPSPFVKLDVQPAGRVGATTASKFSVSVTV